MSISTETDKSVDEIVKEEVKTENVSDEEAKPPPSEEFAYLERGGFSSEMYKIEVLNLPKYYGVAELKKLLNFKLGLKPTKIKSRFRRSELVYIGFPNEEEKIKAIKVLQGYIWKGCTFKVRQAAPAPDPLVKKRNKERDVGPNKKPKLDNAEEQDEKLKNSVLHYWKTPYEEQVKIKDKQMRKILMRLGNDLFYQHNHLRHPIQLLREKFGGLICDYKGIRSPAQIEGYRNKCEFTIGIDAVTNLPTVGYRLGGYITGVTGVAPVDNMVNTSEDVKKAAAFFQEFVRKSEYPVYSVENYSGYWRQYAVRKSWKTGKLMVIIGIHPQVLTDTRLDDVKQSLKDYFSNEEAKSLNISSVYFYIMKKKVGDERWVPEHLLGDTHLTEEILGMTFRISPDAFFQTNTLGAELMYKSLIELAAPTPQSTVVDICCGTGTIGLCFAKSCKKVYGIEMNPEAIKDAKANSALNNVDNCEWFEGKAEVLLGAVLSRVDTPDVTAIVDPPRIGLHRTGIVQLRMCKKVKRVVYACCDAKASLPSVSSLCRPPSKTLKGMPFVPTAAVTIDMFPFTKHVELLILLERKEISDEPLQAEEDFTEDSQIVNSEDQFKNYTQ